MKHVGIICEFNPFHTGHARLLRAVRGADTVICLMSGPFVQRGEAAILPAHVRAAMAIEAGADLVLELPYPFAAASARYFATAGVRALAALGTDTLAFGSERGDLAALRALADRAPNSDFRKRAANVAQNKGDATAYFEALGDDAASNDILAIEYLRAIKKENLPLDVTVLAREGAAYTDKSVRVGEYPSATALREMIRRGENVEKHIPSAAYPLFLRGMEQYGAFQTERLGQAMLALLRHPLLEQSFAHIAECGGGLLGRLRGAAGDAVDYETLLALAATKRYTNGRIRRALLYLLSGVTVTDLATAPAYLRLLAMNKQGREFLSKTDKIRTVPVVSKQSEIAALGEAAARQRALSLAADGLFSLCAQKPMLPRELQTQKPYLKINT